MEFWRQGRLTLMMLGLGAFLHRSKCASGRSSAFWRQDRLTLTMLGLGALLGASWQAVSKMRSGTGLLILEAGRA